MQGVPGFVDQHEIAQEGTDASFTSGSGLIVSDSAAVEEDGSLVAQESTVGDLYGDGTYCEMLTQVSYENLESDAADSMYFQSITCSDGWGCETRALGRSKRRPG
jgi:hypothetical protein